MGRGGAYEGGGRRGAEARWEWLKQTPCRTGGVRQQCACQFVNSCPCRAPHLSGTGLREGPPT
ncbi:hypothetical protein Sgou_46190 [Streptomyces gougerotii]|uniref:Uncharacterized protein n=2 Tax=Streptomyces diastaticus group TaxID=2849069 RepID=A0A8H9HGI6_9ACTN|nr:hypothetical protein Srut_19880 [Streptomyces rutgersensis]GFH69526.1 hypothetical protein Sdia_02940 [Streptomyces diastaticus subsp. diastaticus]GFH79949.1 hypothetical protein Sgou_46190 [Streptomyces gougerotii]GGU35897.1 hypothetical protein GCM10015534_43010 [Streptomyces diastaticus subsp. diastaticus]GGU63789.1 hypothetical protein GCM10010227_16670 [Streptomyces gougerotii]